MKRINRNGQWLSRGTIRANYGSSQFLDLEEWWPLGRNWRQEYAHWGFFSGPSLNAFELAIADTQQPGLYVAGSPLNLSQPAVYSSLPVTLSCWVEPFTLTAEAAVIYLGQISAWNAVLLTITPTAIKALHAEASTFAVTEATVNVPLREAIHLVGVFESLSSRKLYRNGVLVASNATALGSESVKTVLRIGADGHDTNQAYVVVGDVRVYRGALSPDRIWALYDPATRYDMYRETVPPTVFVLTPPTLYPPFIASTAQIFVPTIVTASAPPDTVMPPFIASTAQVFAPTLVTTPPPTAPTIIGTSQFPAEIDEPKNLLIASNNAAAILSSPLTSGAFPPFDLAVEGSLANFSFSGAITLDSEEPTTESSEILYYDGKSGSTLSITNRARDGTTAKTWPAGSVVQMRPIARHHNLLAETLIVVEEELVAVGAEVTSRVLKAGDTMTGPLILSGAPTLDLQAATKAYVDSSVIIGGGGGGAGALPYGTFWMNDLNASGSAVTTTGSITSGTNSLTVASSASFVVGQGIYIAGAAVAGAHLVTSITAITGTTITLAATASVTVSNVKVQHDDTVAIQTAINLISSIHSLTLLFDNGTYRINGPINPATNSILTLPHSPYNQGIPRTLRLFGQSTMMADVLSTPSPQGTIIQSDQTGTSGNSSMFNVGAPYTGNSFSEIFFLCNSGTIDIRDMYWRTHDNPRISAIDLWMGNNVFLTNVTVDTGHNPQGSLFDDSLAGAEPTHGTFAIRLPRVSTLSQTNNVSITNYEFGLIYSDLFHSISLFIQRCKTALMTRGHDYPVTGVILIVQCGTGLYVEGGNSFGRPGLDCTFKYEIDPRNLGHWWETAPNKYIYDGSNILFGQLKYYIVQGYSPGVGMPMTVTGTTALTKINLHA